MKTNTEALAQLLKLFNAHPRKRQLKKIAKSGDQLARALVPLYIATGERTLHVGAPIDISSVTSERFWLKLGHKMQATRIAKALREHVGYARNTKTGKQITPNGVKYIEHML
jgi:hypothetical protein